MKQWHSILLLLYKYNEEDVFFCNDIIETEDELIKIILIILYVLFGHVFLFFLIIICDIILKTYLELNWNTKKSL